jgi:hypothetical protein
MFSFTYDPGKHVLVVYANAQSKSDADHEELYRYVDRLDLNGHNAKSPIALVLAIDNDSPSPSASWRRRYAEQRKNMKSPRAFITVVTTSAVARGVLTAINWISPDPAHVRTVTHSTIDEAATWIELTHGIPGAALCRMHEEAVAGGRPAKVSVR